MSKLMSKLMRAGESGAGEGGQRDPDGEQRHTQKWVGTSNSLSPLTPVSS